MFCFFFKQKSAYEVRISDWSSDVCSSDLRCGDALRGGLGDGLWVDRGLRGRGGCLGCGAVDVGAEVGELAGDLVLLQGGLLLGAEFAEIGSASCRERVLP